MCLASKKRKDFLLLLKHLVTKELVMTDHHVSVLIHQIEEIQGKKYVNWISAWANKIKVDRLHAQLDKLAYVGQRPPRTWNQHRN